MGAVILSSSTARRRRFRWKSIRSRRRLSDDLIEHCILPLLPVSSLLRFQFVSTRWHHLIVNPHFVLLHSRIHTSPPPPLLLCTNTKTLEEPTAQLFDPETHSSLEVESFIRRIYHQFGWVAGMVVASCTGLVCMSFHGPGKQVKLVIGNPLLRDWKLIPDPPCIVRDISNNSCGLVIDSDVTCKLVIFSITQLGGTGFNQQFHVFTPSTGLWETIQERVVSPSYTDVWPTTFESGNVASVGGILYAMCNLNYLLWFDPKEKRSGYQPLPPRTISYLDPYFTTFGEWNGELSYTKPITNLDGIEIWSMKDHRKPCWTKKHTISFNSIIRENLCFARFNKRRMDTAQLMPFEGVNLMFWIQGRLYSYNVNTGQAEYLLKGSHFDWISYRRSLVIWPNPGQMSAA